MTTEAKPGLNGASWKPRVSQPGEKLTPAELARLRWHTERDVAWLKEELRKNPICLDEDDESASLPDVPSETIDPSSEK